MTNRADNNTHDAHVSLSSESIVIRNDNTTQRKGKESQMARKATTKVCTKCGGTFDVSEFYKDKSQKDGRSSWCKACERAYNRAYFASLKKAGGAKKAVIVNDAKALATFERGMKGERVKRGARTNATTNDGTRTNAAKARTKARKNATRAKRAGKANA